MNAFISFHDPNTDTLHMFTMERRLPFIQKVAYTVGHGSNDLIIAFTWSYAVLYMQISLNLPEAHIGYVFLAMQIADAVAEAFTGIFSDRWNGCCHIGKRKSLYLIGATMQVISFVLVCCVGVEATSGTDSIRLIYCIFLFGIYSGSSGVALISHLSMLPEISSSRLERVQLHGWRNAMQVLCFVTVYLAVLIILYIHKGSSDSSQLSESDAEVLRILAIFCAVLGLIYITIFMTVVKENRKNELFVADNCSEDDNCKCTNYNQLNSIAGTVELKGSEEIEIVKENYQCKIIATKETIGLAVNVDTRSSNTGKNDRDKLDIKTTIVQDSMQKNSLKRTLKGYRFYTVTVIFTCARYAVITSQLYMPLYTTKTLGMDKVSIAVMPLLVYVSGFVASILMKKVHKRFGKRKAFIAGGVVTVGSCLWIFFVSANSYQQIYATSVFFGAGLATSQVTATAMITDLIGQNTQYGASVYGIIGTVEKFTEGIGLVILQTYNPCGNTTSSSCLTFYKNIMVAAPGAATCLAFFALLIDILLGKWPKT